MLAFQLNRRVLIQRPKQTRDSFGQRSTDWEFYCYAWAHIRPGSGREFIEAGKETSEVDVSVRVRYRTDLDASMRVIIDGRPMNIKAVIPDLANRTHTDLVCGSGANNG